MRFSKRVIKAVRTLNKMNVKEEYIAVPTRIAEKLLKEGPTYLGMRIVHCSGLPPMILSTEQTGRFVLIPED